MSARVLVAGLWVVLLARPAHAQTTTTTGGLSLKDLLTELTQPIVNDPTSNQLGAVLAGTAGLEVSTAPLASSSGGFTYTFDPKLGIVARRVTTFGPSFSERAFTLGAHKASIGLNYTWTHYDRLQGQDVQNGGLIVRTSRDATGNNQIQYALGLDLKTRTLTVFGSYGVVNNLDVAIAVPYVQVDMTGEVLVSTPRGLAQRLEADGSASGIGDVAVRAKYRLMDKPQGAIAVGIDARLPTGDEDNLLGTGSARTLTSLIASVAAGPIWVHGNAGYEFWSRGFEIPDLNTGGKFSAKNQVVYALSTDIPAHPKVTVSAELSGRALRNGGRLGFSTFSFPANPTNIRSAEALVALPDSLRRVSAIGGVKWNVWGTALLTANVLVPLVHDGLTARITPVFGFDWSF